MPGSHGDEADFVRDQGPRRLFNLAKVFQHKLDTAFVGQTTPDRQLGGPGIDWSMWPIRTWWPCFMVNTQI